MSSTKMSASQVTGRPNTVTPVAKEACEVVCHPNRVKCCRGRAGSHCFVTCGPCSGDHGRCGAECLTRIPRDVGPCGWSLGSDVMVCFPEGRGSMSSEDADGVQGVSLGLREETLPCGHTATRCACGSLSDSSGSEGYWYSNRSTRRAIRRVKQSNPGKSPNTQSIVGAEDAKLEFERIRDAYSIVVSFSGTIMWVFAHPGLSFGKFLWAWLSTYWLVFAMIRRAVKAACDDVKGSLVVALLGCIAWMILDDSYSMAFRKYRMGVVTGFLRPEKLEEYWFLGAPQFGEMLLEGFKLTWLQGSFELCLVYVVVFTFIGWFRAVQYVWAYASVAKQAVPVGHLDRLALKRIDVYKGAAVFEKDEATGLFQKIYLDQTGRYQVRLIGFGDETSMATLASGRTLESAMPFSPVEKLGKIHTHTGSVLMNGQTLGMWFRVGNYFLTAVHVYEGMIAQPTVLIAANGKDPLVMNVGKWKVARKGADLIALIPPIELFTVLGVTSGKLASPKSDEFVAVERDENGMLGVAWGKLSWEEWDGSTVGHTVSTKAGCSGAPLVTRSGQIVGMHTHTMSVVEKGSKKALNFAIPSATLSIVLGLTRQAESPRSEERRRIREQKVEEYQAEAERDDEYEEIYHDYESDEDVRVRTSKREHRYARGQAASVRGGESDQYEKYHTGNFQRDMESGKDEKIDLGESPTSTLPADFQSAAKVPAVEVSKAVFAKAKAGRGAVSSEKGQGSTSQQKVSMAKTEALTPQLKPDLSGGVGANLAGKPKRKRNAKSKPESATLKSPSTDSHQGTAPPS